MFNVKNAIMVRIIIERLSIYFFHDIINLYFYSLRKSHHTNIENLGNRRNITIIDIEMRNILTLTVWCLKYFISSRS